MPLALNLLGSPGGTKNLGPINMGGGPNLITRSLFASSTPTLPYSQWYEPGRGSPAMSLADYYHINGWYWSRPYDLDLMGSEGATIKAREGYRYIWIIGSDHPSNTNFNGGGGFFVGYSNDPQIFPSPLTVRTLLTQNASITVLDQLGFTQTSFGPYMIPHLVYNPDSGGDKFWIYAEGSGNGRQHELTLFTTADFLTATIVEPVIPTSNFGGWSSFGKPKRLGVNNWVVYSFGKYDGSGPFPVPSSFKYTSTDGRVWTPDFSRVVAGPGPYYTFGGKDYCVINEIGASNDYVSLLEVDANKVSTGNYTRITAAYGKSTGDDTAYPWQTWLQSAETFDEDGVLSVYVTRGFFSGVTNNLLSGPYRNNFPTFYDVTASITSNVVNITSMPPGVPPIEPGFRLLFLPGNPFIASTPFSGTGTGGVGTYAIDPATPTSDLASTTIKIATNGGMMQQWVDLYYYIMDATAAAGAAPLGVEADCAGGVVTVRLNDCLPNGTYRIYRGTSAGSQPTLVGDFTGASTTFALASDAQCFIKVVKMNAGTEQKSRVVSVYSSNRTKMVNRHVNRVLNDGGAFQSPATDIAFLATVDAYLTSNDYWKYLLYWVDARFGIKVDGSGFVSKVYCLGTTQLPRGGDYTPTTSNTFPSTSSNTSYSATSFRGTTPSWVNNASTARGYFGNGRPNNIQRKNEITLIAAYQKSHNFTVTMFGMSQFNSGLYLQHESGATGNVTFMMSHAVTPITVSTPFASSTVPHVAAAMFDGSNIKVVLDGVTSSPVDASVANNPSMRKDTTLRGQYTTSLDGTANHDVLMSGTRTGLMVPSTKVYNNSDSQGQMTQACLIGFEKALPAAVAAIAAMYA